jgi:3-hydroxyphenylacetate 6-hydroxylase
MRLLNSFRIEKYDDFNAHPVDGADDPTSLVALPKRYRALFIPRNEKALSEALERTKPRKAG